MLQERELPVAYFPHQQGPTLREAGDLFGALLADPRLRLLEISEYASLGDLDRRGAGQLVDLLAEGLKR